ncbi:MAG TPA: DUF1499 domain-containing protein [Acetobacteraceae bacterium]|jgi:uncharacterized protein (DUF1499 family)|nr:DUF1499 domain-containing protein [Acetobacteraceae bacterium]
MSGYTVRMTPLAWLVGLFLPACAAIGARGLPVPPPTDLAHISRPASPNTALAAPAGFHPAPDIVTPVFPASAEQLFAAVQKVAAAEPRTWAAAIYADRMQADWVVRSAVFNFPDLVTAQIAPAGLGAATLVLYSRSVYGYSDLGVNRRRVVAWLAALDRTLNPAKER